MYVSFILCNMLRFVNYIINLYDDNDDGDEQAVKTELFTVQVSVGR